MSETQTYIVPLENKNRYTSLAFKSWGESETLKHLTVLHRSIGSPFETKVTDYIKKEFIKNFVRAKEDLYIQRERDKNAFNEIQIAMTEKLELVEKELQEAKERLIKLQAPTK